MQNLYLKFKLICCHILRHRFVWNVFGFRNKCLPISLQSVWKYINNNKKIYWTEDKSFCYLFALPLGSCYNVVLMIFILLAFGANQHTHIHSHLTMFPHLITLTMFHMWWFNMIFIASIYVDPAVLLYSIDLHTHKYIQIRHWNNSNIRNILRLKEYFRTCNIEIEMSCSPLLSTCWNILILFRFILI